MKTSWPRIVALSLGALLLGLPPAGAQEDGACQRYRSELSSLQRSGSHAGTLQRQRQEIARLTDYYRTIGCGGLFFFAKPPECGAIAQRIRQMEASLSYLAGQVQVDPYEVAARARQLREAIVATCGSEPASPGRLSGSTRLVCVRTCDGYFFPMQNGLKGRGKAAELCQALCPNAETALYRAPLDGSIEHAVSETGGRPYSELPNAMRYTREIDKSCTCRKPDESWASTLRKAESLVGHARSDVVVTSEIAERLFQERLRAARTAGEKRNALAGGPAAPADLETTGSVEPVEAEDEAGDGDGARRPRVISPGVIPVPAAAR